MKNVLLLYGLCLFLCVANNLSAQEIQTNERGEIRVKSERKLTQEEIAAYHQPGTEIPILTTKGSERIGFFYYGEYQSYNSVKVFNGQYFETIKKSGKIYGEETLAIYVLLLIIAIISMIISNIFYKKGNDEIAAPSFAAVAAIFIIAAIFVLIPVFTFALPVLGVAFIATIGATCNADHDPKFYKIYTTIFYILVVFGIVTDYII